MTDTTSTTPQLKPCPFCGGYPKVFEGQSIVSVTCENCGYEFDWPAHGATDWRKEWNTRPTEAALEAENAHLMHASEEVMAENVRLQQRVEELEKAARPPLVPKIDPDLGW
jgi:DNA replicative helicase MCM subunit Mcm2 (Cdc46/Mcm family)